MTVKTMRSPGAGDVAGVTTGVAAAVGVAAGVGCAVAAAVGIGVAWAAADGPGVMAAAPALHPASAIAVMATAATPRRRWDWNMTVVLLPRSTPVRSYEAGTRAGHSIFVAAGLSLEAGAAADARRPQPRRRPARDSPARGGAR